MAAVNHSAELQEDLVTLIVVMNLIAVSSL